MAYTLQTRAEQTDPSISAKTDPNNAPCQGLAGGESQMARANSARHEIAPTTATISSRNRSDAARTTNRAHSANKQNRKAAADQASVRIGDTLAQR